jgi:lytic murein transglycosylase
MLRALLAALALILAVPAAAAVDRPAVERAFETWIDQSLWPEAKVAGVSRATFDIAFRGVTLDWTMPELQPPGAPKILPPNTAQAEFRDPGAYFRESNLKRMVIVGRQKLDAWSKPLASIAARYGVSAPILVAIWGRESGFGSENLPKLVVPALATEAFIGLRKDYFRGELIAALKILQHGDVKPGDMRASWAGAMGQSQVMPSEYLASAVDFDGDGRADIWKSAPDSLATTARVITAHGWEANRNWGVEARVPASVSCTLEGPDQGKPLAEWRKLGITRVDGSPLPADIAAKGGKNYLLMPAGRYGPAFVVTDNFYRLKAYNNSDLYALYIGHLADRITGNDKPFASAWSAPGGFTRAEVKAMQDRLVATGYDVGKADGLVGYKTRIAIGLWQARHGMAPTCWPDAKLVTAIR